MRLFGLLSDSTVRGKIFLFKATTSNISYRLVVGIDDEGESEAYNSGSESGSKSDSSTLYP